MTGINAALNTAVSGLLAQQQAIAATSENIANVNTENFARRDVNFFTDAIPNQFAGVNVEIVRAGVNRFLQSASYDSRSDAGETSVVAEALARVELSLGAPGDNISFANKLNDAFAAFAELSAVPSSIAAKTTALGALEEAFSAFSRTLAAVDTEMSATDARLVAQADRVNGLLRNIYNLNLIVIESPSAGDEIDASLAELSSLIDINVTRTEDGIVTVSASNGQLLANGGGYSALGVAVGATATVSLSSVDPDTGVETLVAADINSLITSGELSGLLSLRNVELPALRQIVEGAALDVVNEINAAYAANASVGATGPTTTPLIVQSGGGFAVNPAIMSDPAQLAIARPTGGGAGGANDGQGASAIAALGAGPAAQNAASAVLQLSAAAQVANERMATAQTFSTEVETRVLNEGGVNLDEELSNLILYQRAYNANARVIAAVDEMYEALLNII